MICKADGLPRIPRFLDMVDGKGMKIPRPRLYKDASSLAA